MSTPRGRRRFEPAGNLRADELPLPRRLAQALGVAQAWHEVAGGALAGRAPVERLARGVLTLREPLEPWTARFRELVPELVARMIEAHPELGIKSYRVVGLGAAAAARPVKIHAGRRIAKSGDPD